MAFIKSYSSSKKQCNRKYMEDYYNIHFCFENDCWIFNVCDGHGGYQVAEFINKNFNIYLIDKINLLKKAHKEINTKMLKTSIKELIEELDKEIEKLPCAEFTGSTFASVIYYQNHLYFINIGDSNIICNMVPIYFNKLHVPTNKEERLRIIRNTFIENNRIEGMINLSRAFGDFRFKQKDKSLSPIISTPDIDVLNINEVLEYNKYPWILISSDGLLILFQRVELCKIINMYLKNGYTCDYVVKLLISYCHHHNNDDNVTIILIILENKEKSNFKVDSFKVIRDKIMKYCMEPINNKRKIKWKEYLFYVKKQILVEFKNIKNLEYIYKLLEFEVISKLSDIKL